MDLTFQPLTRAEFPLVSHWLRTPHVVQWWREPFTMEQVEAKYGPCIDGLDPTLVFIVRAAGYPIGFFQSYLVDDYPLHAAAVGLPGAVGVDLFIGEPDYLYRGYGSAMLRAFNETMVPRLYPGATHVIADPNFENGVSIRAFEKAGYIRGSIIPGPNGPEQLMIAELSANLAR